MFQAISSDWHVEISQNSPKNFADFTIFPCFSSHISSLTNRNYTKLTLKLYLMMILIIAKVKEILLTGTWLKLQIWQKFR